MICYLVRIEVLFSWRKILALATVVLLFVCVNYCLIIY